MTEKIAIKKLIAYDLECSCSYSICQQSRTQFRIKTRYCLADMQTADLGCFYTLAEAIKMFEKISIQRISMRDYIRSIDKDL